MIRLIVLSGLFFFFCFVFLFAYSHRLGISEASRPDIFPVTLRYTLICHRSVFRPLVFDPPKLGHYQANGPRQKHCFVQRRPDRL
jgi:hypothetical protein